MTLQDETTGTLAAQMEQVAAELVEKGIERATADPRRASQGPIGQVLVTPPTRDFVRSLTTWTLAVLANTQDTGLETTHKLAAVVDQLADAVPVESARPGSVQLTRDQPPTAAYLVTFTSS